MEFHIKTMHIVIDQDVTPNGHSIFTALHEMQTRSSDENSLRPSVRKCVNSDKMEKNQSRSLYHTKDHLA